MASKGRQQQSEASDLGSLWTKAVNDYLKKTGKDMSHLEAQSIGAVMDSTKTSMQTFAGFRHKGDKVDKVRSAFGNHLGGMQKCMQGIQMIGAVAGAFPPAMPVGIVFAACGQLLNAFAAVKADYDKVEDFFNHSGRFFERLSIIENKDCDVGPLGIAIVRVFSTQLSIFAIVEAMVKEKGARFKQWLNALWNMKDQDLAAAYGTMQASIEELAETVGYASYAAIKSTQDVTVTVSAKADEIDENIKKFRSELDQDVRLLYESNLNLEAKIDDGFNMVSRKMTILAQHQAEIQAQFHAQLLKAVQTEKKINRPDQDDKNQTRALGGKGGKGDVGDKRFRALRNIKTYFDSNSHLFPNWRDAQKENTAQHQDIKEACVRRTSDWLSDDASFRQWTEDTNPLLWIKGQDGIGKSFLAYASLQKLPVHEDGHTSAAYFYFKEDFPYLQSVQNAFACAALQIAETNTRYAEQVAARLQEDGSNATETSTWRRFFLSVFGGSSQGSANSASTSDRLYLVFDGLDEAPEQQRQIFLQFLADLKKEDTRVHVLVTGRPEETKPIMRLEPLLIEATKDKMLHDIRILIWDRLNTFSRLKKFTLAVKKVIRRKVARQADSMLYVEHMLRRLSYIGRERAVLKDLEHMPNDLQDLYRLMLDECRRNRSNEQYETLKKLFSWLAFSKRSLSLAEATGLVKLTITEDDFDIEDEIIGRSARILELSRSRHLDEDAEHEGKDEDHDDQGEEHEPELEEYRNASLTFQERSLREYFKAVSVKAHGKEELRTPASAAHLIILKMCVDILTTTADDPRQEEVTQMRNYAVNYWYEHLNELDVDSASDKEVSDVLGSLYSIASNKNNTVADAFELISFPMSMYPERDETSSVPWFDRIHSWTSKATSIPEGMLTPEVKAWAANLVDNPNDVLVPLAKGHLDNWSVAWEEFWICESYNFAVAALKLSKRFHEVKDNPLEEILMVTDTFGPRERDAKLMRAIGTKLFQESSFIEEEERRSALHVEAISYLKKSLEMIETDRTQIGSTLHIIAALYARKEEWQNAIDALSKEVVRIQELLADPDRAEQKDELNEANWEIHVNIAQYLERLEKKDAALDMYNEARRLAGDQTIGSYNLDDITIILDENLDPDGTRLMDALSSWTVTERNKWFEWCIPYLYLEPLGRMYRAAKLSGRTDLVLEWLNEFGQKMVKPRSLLSFSFNATLAGYYNMVLHDMEKAKEAMHAALKSDPKVESMEEDTLSEMTSAVRLDLAGIIFSQFRATPDPERKDALLEEMKALPGMTTDDKYKESHIGMLVANMLRIMGPARDYQNYMNQIFKTCIDGLEDSVSWNDGYSLRLMAKVLSSLPGLERDARITISAQFSILDRSIHDSEIGSQTVSEDGDEEVTENGEASREPNGVNDTPDDGHTEAVTEDDTIAGADKGAPPRIEISDTQADAKAPARVDDKPSNSEEHGPSSEKEELPISEGDKGMAADSAGEHKNLEDCDEDITSFSIDCDGCDTRITQWTAPSYLCLICPNTDLCEACHDKRQAWNRDEGQEPWNRFCAKNHHYIKGPMKGWKGIKNGVIRIDDGEFEVKEWVKGLKEERWPKAWERYWLRQGGLKDIGIAD